MDRKLINPPHQKSFDDVYAAIHGQVQHKTPDLRTTGKGVSFIAEAKIAGDGRKFISLPHDNRIYKGDWDFTSNSMGIDGQRIAQYSVPLDQWTVEQSNK